MGRGFHSLFSNIFEKNKEKSEFHMIPDCLAMRYYQQNGKIEEKKKEIEKVRRGKDHQNCGDTKSETVVTKNKGDGEKYG